MEHQGSYSPEQWIELRGFKDVPSDKPAMPVLAKYPGNLLDSAQVYGGRGDKDIHCSFLWDNEENVGNE